MPVNARREDELEQISLEIVLDRGDEATISLKPEQRRRLMDLMAAAILAVHRANHGLGSEEGDNDDARK